MARLTQPAIALLQHLGELCGSGRLVDVTELEERRHSAAFVELIREKLVATNTPTGGILRRRPWEARRAARQGPTTHVRVTGDGWMRLAAIAEGAQRAQPR